MTEITHFGLCEPADPDPNTVYSTGSLVQKVTDTGDFLIVADPQLATFTVGDNTTKYGRLLYKLMTTPGMYRSLGVSQLCKDEASATIPNTAQFTRHSGMIALSHIVDHFGAQSGFSSDQHLAAQLDAVADDRAHTIYSHALELKLQGWGGRENRHEELWPEYARHGGELAVLQQAGVKLDNRMRIPGIKLPSWVNEKAPNIDPDRYQYAISEMLEWFDNDNSPPAAREMIRSLCSLDNLAIDNNGKLAFKDLEMARLFAKGYLLLATEHWNDPINRMQLYLITQAAQRLILQRQLPDMNEIDKGQTRRPEWYLYGIDQDIVDALNRNHGHTDPTLYAIHGILFPIAAAERKRFVRYKQGEYAGFLQDASARDYPSEHLEPKRVEFGLAHPSVAISMELNPVDMRSDTSKMPVLDDSGSGHLSYQLMPLKNRYVDPPVMQSDGSSKPVSVLDANFASLLQQQQTIMSMATRVDLVFAGDFRRAFIEGINENEVRFDGLADNPDFTDDQKRHTIELAAERAKKIAVRAGRLVLP